MGSHDETVRTLRDALRLSPENIPLRRHLADVLLEAGHVEEAEVELRAALRVEPASVELRAALVDVFLRRGKVSEALIVLEGLVKEPDVPTRVRLLQARALAESGDPGGAALAYHAAVDADPDAADPALAARLGIWSDEEPDEPLEIVDGRIRAAVDGMEPEAGELVPIERPTTTFADVGGMDALKEEIAMKIILPLQQPELFEAYGKKAGGGILLYGPPGCGKTHLARATAGEVEARFLTVGIHDVLDMWIGESERKLHELFQTARANRPCVLFFDEVDALGASRSEMRGSAGRHVINQFLAELDGVDAKNDDLLVLGATNAPWHLDSAFRRPGRFDRVIFVPPPDRAARAAILQLLLAKKPAAEVDCDAVAKRTDHYSGADLRAVVDAAVEEKLKLALKTRKPSPLTTKDLLAAAKRRQPTTKEWFATARNYALYSNQGGVYDEILDWLKLR